MNELAAIPTDEAAEPAPACPCCGQPVDPERILVDLDTNSVARNGQIVRLSPYRAEILETLARAYPRTVRHDALISAIYGGGEEPDEAARAIKVHISYLRVDIARLGLDIECAWRIGYRLLVDAERPRNGTRCRWTEAERARLRRLVEVDGLSGRQAARRLDKPAHAIYTQLRRLGIRLGRGRL